jgi:hypothetical protein
MRTNAFCVATLAVIYASTAPWSGATAGERKANSDASLPQGHVVVPNSSAQSGGDANSASGGVRAQTNTRYFYPDDPTSLSFPKSPFEFQRPNRPVEPQNK